VRKKMAVYGTLRWGQRNHWILEESEFIGTGKVKGKIFGQEVPFFQPGPKGKVVVEVYSVDPKTLRILDLLEDHPRSYRRVKRYVKEGDKVLGYCWIYTWPWWVNEEEEIFSGDFCNR
jgi:gamma-glutamylaminecyclotransferase